MSVNICICCGSVVPEGRQVCPYCEMSEGDAPLSKYFDSYEDALAYAEGREDWKFFRIRHTDDGRYIAYRIGWRENELF